MTLTRIEPVFTARLTELTIQGTSKGDEQVICGIAPPQDGFGPRYYLCSQEGREFLRMNSNSYLGLSLHPKVVEAEEETVRSFGTGPGAVRFISGTHGHHLTLEAQLARFHRREAAMLFSSAYAAMLGILPQLISAETMVLSDTLNHNCIITALRLAKPLAKAVFRHNDMEDLEASLAEQAGKAKRVLVVTDGVFSMRGDHTPLDRLVAICRHYQEQFEEGVITVVDDSHGVGAFGASGRGTEEHCGAHADILVGTLGKAFGVNGGYVATSGTVIRYLRETAPLYIYSNPITPAEAAAALQALEILDSHEGQALLDRLHKLTKRFETGLAALGFEVIRGPHPIVPLLVRDTARTGRLVTHLFTHGILATGIQYPVVPVGDEEIRFQVNANHTEKDIDYVLEVLREYDQKET